MKGVFKISYKIYDGFQKTVSVRVLVDEGLNIKEMKKIRNITEVNKTVLNMETITHHLKKPNKKSGLVLNTLPKGLEKPIREYLLEDKEKSIQKKMKWLKKENGKNNGNNGDNGNNGNNGSNGNNGNGKTYIYAEAKGARDKSSYLDKGDVVQESTGIVYKQEGEPIIENSAASKTSSSKQEEMYLAWAINYYLKFIGLKTINLKELLSGNKNEEYPLFRIGTLGDMRINFDIRSHVTEHELVQYYQSNEAQKNVLVNLGFRGIASNNVHLAGTFLEIIYYIAYEQDNMNVRNRILKELLGVYYKTNQTELNIPYVK